MWTEESSNDNLRSAEEMDDVKVPYDFTFEGMIKRRRQFTILFLSMLIPFLCGLFVSNRDMILAAIIIGGFALGARINLTNMLRFMGDVAVSGYKAQLSGEKFVATKFSIRRLLSFFITDTLMTFGITVVGSGFCAYAFNLEGNWVVALIFVGVAVLGFIGTVFSLWNPAQYYWKNFIGKRG